MGYFEVYCSVSKYWGGVLNYISVEFAEMGMRSGKGKEGKLGRKGGKNDQDVISTRTNSPSWM